MTLRIVRQTAVAITLAACLAGCGSTGSLSDRSDSDRPAHTMYDDAEARDKWLVCRSASDSAAKKEYCKP
jgi:hypothetical protein